MFKTVKNVAKHSFIYGIGDMLTKLVAFVLIPLYTHYITTSEYGVLELINLCSYILGFIIAMGIGQSVVRYYFEFEEQEKREQVISVALVSVWLFTAAGFLLLYLSADLFSVLVFETAEYQTLFQIMFATLAITASNEIPLHFIRIKQESVRFIVISLIRVFFTLSLNILFIVYFGLGITGILLGGLIANGIVSFYLIGYTLRRIEFSFSLPLLKQMLAYSLPLIWSWLGGFILHFSDRFLLQRLTTLSQVGVYALGYKFGLLLNVFVHAPFNRTWAPKQFEIAKEKDAPETFSLVFTYFCFLQFFITLGLSAIIHDLIFVISEPSYHEAANYVPVILLAYNCNGAYTFFQFALLQHKRTGVLGVLTLGSGLVNIVLNLFLIPQVSAWGAAISTLISFALLFLLTYYRAQRLFYIPVEFLRISKMAVVGVLLYLVAAVLPIHNPYLAILIKGGVACLFPLLLRYVNFYNTAEKEKMFELFQRLPGKRAVK